MYDTALVPLDGSEVAQAIMPHVKAMATDHQAEVILLDYPATDSKNRREANAEGVL
jgi:hypothetical protein